MKYLLYQIQHKNRKVKKFLCTRNKFAEFYGQSCRSPLKEGIYDQKPHTSTTSQFYIVKNLEPFYQVTEDTLD